MDLQSYLLNIVYYDIEKKNPQQSVCLLILEELDQQILRLVALILSTLSYKSLLLLFMMIFEMTVTKTPEGGLNHIFISR